MRGLLHTGLGRDALSNWPATVFFAIADDRPAVISSCQRQVDLVAALGSVLMGP